MVLVAGQRLRDDRVAAIGKVEHRAKVILQLGMLVALVAGAREHRNRFARLSKIPAGQIEEMDWLLENPVADLLDVIAPAARALAIGVAPQLHQAGPRGPRGGPAPPSTRK